MIYNNLFKYNLLYIIKKYIYLIELGGKLETMLHAIDTNLIPMNKNYNVSSLDEFIEINKSLYDNVKYHDYVS